jgi:hypothetical protein
MSAPELLEIGKIFGSILVAWFALVGWKLLPTIRAHQSRRKQASLGVRRESGLQPATSFGRNAIPPRARRTRVVSQHLLG